MSSIDFKVEDNGSLFRVVIQNEDAQRWAREFIDIPEWAWAGTEAFCVEHHLIGNLLTGMDEEGWKYKVAR